MQNIESKSKKSAVIITLIIIAVAAAGVFWYMQSQDGGDTSYDTGKLSENLKGIEAQDNQYASVTQLELQPLSAVEEKYQVLRPLEKISTENTSQQSNESMLSAVEAYALGKNGDDGRTQYNASFFTYRLEGEIADKSTGQIVKSQLDSAIVQAKKPQPNGASVAVGSPKKVVDITMKTSEGEPVKLASSKFEQTVMNGSTEKKLVSLVAAAKLGNQLLFVNATFADESTFGQVSQHLRAMADLITLKLSE